MTINFIPGEVNRTENSVSHGRWKDHYIIVYGSGNNLVISSLTFKNNITDHLQTIYLESDPSSIDFNASSGFIAISVKSKVLLLKPVNEFMSRPQWSVALEVSAHSTVNCMHWAPVENELAIGTSDSIELFKIYEEYGALKYHRRWFQTQAISVTALKITFNSNKIVVQNGDYDRLLKVWSRINYGDDNTLFELTYLPHPVNDFILDFKWRFRLYSKSSKVIDESMANIKNIRNYIDTGNEDSDTLFTFSYNKVFRVWSTYESSGHNSIKCWGQLDLSDCFVNQTIVAVVLIDNYYLQKTLFRQLEGSTSELANYFKDQLYDNIDLLLVVSNLGQVALYSISNVSMIPPNSIRFERIDTMAMEFNKFSFSSITESVQSEDISSEAFKISLKPVVVPKIALFDKDDATLSLLFHNRLKNTLKLNTLNFKQLLKPNTPCIGTNLVNKFQGHDKSIRKLIKSYKSNTHSILLSISNFAKNNYIWEPLTLKKPSKRTIITKKFQIDLTLVNNDPNNFIYDALLLNDIEGSPGKRRHLVISFDKLGFLTLWDCNELEHEDKCAEVIYSEHVEDKAPKVLQLVQIEKDEYLIVSIYELDEVRCWKLKLTKENSKNIDLFPWKIQNLPPVESRYKINKIENLINDKSSSLISIIEEGGHLSNYSIKFAEIVEWVETSSFQTNIKNCSKVMGSSIINKIAFVDETGYKLQIWDSKAKLLEYEEEFNAEQGAVRDIDWCLISSPDRSCHNVLLSIGFQRFVMLYTQLRYDYTNNIPTYAPLKKIDISDYTSHEIGDSIWINNGYLVIGCGNQFFIDDRWFQLGSSGSSLINSMTRQLVRGFFEHDDDDQPSSHETSNQIFDISDIVRLLNGPLPYYHPQFLIQLMYSNQFDLAKLILVKLFQCIRSGEKIKWNLGFDLVDEILYDQQADGRHSILENAKEEDIFSTFNENLVDLLSEKLTKISLPSLTRHQQITLISLINITKLVKKYVGMLDENGLRFLIGFKLYQSSTRQSALNMRDINFALHSRNKDILVSIVEEAYDFKFTLSLVKSLGLVYWIDNYKLLEIVENIAKNEFNNERDPSGIVSLLYMALNKKNILVGLWRTTSHKERQKILAFLAHDFTQNRWQVAAMKNAFALLGKHRYLDSAYFFLLGEKVSDCCSIINSKLGDFQLSLIVSKLYHFVRSKESDTQQLIETSLLKDVIENGDKWVNSWLFWELNQKEMAIQALIKSPIDLIKSSDLNCPNNYTLNSESNKFLNEDPASILLYTSLKSKSLNYQQGSMLITPKEESEFILKICSIYDKMGCDYLALILLRNWKFDYRKFDKMNKINVNGFKEFKMDNDPPPEQIFEEPDMSAFDFGF
ncbi:regulator of (H+)-ATPase in vacuolar membrane [Yamadazyma tenuis]